MSPSTSLSSTDTSSSNIIKDNKSNRGRFFQLARKWEGKGKGRKRCEEKVASSNKSFTTSDVGFRRLSPLKENSISRPSSSSSPDPSAINKSNSYNQNQHKYYPESNQQTQQRQQQQIPETVGDGFSRAELYDIKESFKLFDINGEGSIEVGDLRSTLVELQKEQREQQQQFANADGFHYPHLHDLLFRLSELSDEDKLSIDDYINMMASTSITYDDYEMEDSNENYFARVFGLFDIDGKGYITVNDLERVAAELGEHDMTTEEIQEMIDRAKGSICNSVIDNDGRVYIEDFTRMMTTSLFPRSTT